MDAYNARKKDWEDLDVTRDELNNITECLKKEEFRKLLIEYADEVSNPENRRIYEKEFAELEKERGVDVTFVNPEPGYVIKTSLNGDKKCFVNISKNEKIGKPTSQPSYADGNRGLQWLIPYNLAPPREDLDKKNVRCTVFDVVFHPDTLYIASKNPRFADIVNNTAMDGVESNFKVKLDRKNVKFPKMRFKGFGHPTIIRKACEKPCEPSLDLEPEIYQKLMSSYDECREKQARRAEETPQRAPPPSTYYSDSKINVESPNSVYAVPKFTIKYQSDVDLQEYRDSADAKFNAAIPKKLIVVVDLPLLKSAADASLDVQDKSLTVVSQKPAKYRLELPLPYRVDADNGNAKFDPKYKKLTVTLPVVRSTVKLGDLRDDSGVESDHGSPPLGSGDEIASAAVSDGSSNQSESPDTSKSNSASSIGVSKKINEVESYYEDTALRTNDSIDSDDPLMNPNVKYVIPPFVCNVYDNNLAITINVKNVDAESIRYEALRANSGIHVVLSSVGAGFFPVYYSLCLRMYENAINSESVTVEPWDNNVVFTVNLRDGDNLSKYFVGVDEEFMESKDLPSAMSLTNKFEELMVEPRDESGKTIEVIAEGEDIVINIQSNNLDSDDELDLEPIDRSSRKKERKQHGLSKTRSISESSGDELPSSNASSVSKGILKSRRSTFSRSVSESSIDDATGLPSSVDFHYDSIHDVNSESDCSSFKKSVRFNDVVSRQLYRSNSSILGQRKKNQRKLKNKKRAHERRMSESENSETEDREKYRVNSKDEFAETKSHDTVKPILNRDKLSERKKTDTIKIEKFQNNVNAHSHKTERVASNENDKILINSEDCPTVKDAAGTEFKNDLIFDLDM